MKPGIGKNTESQLWKYFTYLAMFIGITLRITIYIQNRNLFQDEANIARNIYERDFLQLILPLGYRQYAPPLFLCALKCFTQILGYSEYVFRLIPLISGIGSMVLTHLLLRKYRVRKMSWYPLFLLATGYIYIRYATELKQYSTDSFIALVLIYLALSIDIKTLQPVKFVSLWACIGSFALWSSMPSVFILAGIGMYYFSLLYRSGDYKYVYGLAGIIFVWLIQFLVYYEFILKSQIQSDYLQIFHRETFLIIFPQSVNDFVYNWGVFLNVLEAATGYWYYAIKFHLLLILIALFYLFWDRKSSALLLIVPLILLILAAALHQYALTPRITLFVMPLLLILIGIGYEQVFRYKYLRELALCLSFVCMYKFSELKYFHEPLRIVQITDGMDFLVKENIRSNQLYVDDLAFPAYRYYTVINPRNEHWTAIKNAYPLSYTYFDTTSNIMKGKTAILYGSSDVKKINSQQVYINQHMTTLKHYSGISCQAYIYNPQ